MKFDSNNLKVDLTQAKKTALKFNENIIISNADKGKQVVIFDKNHYV